MGIAYATGQNNHGYLGTGNCGSRSCPGVETLLPVVEVGGGSLGSEIVAASVGVYHTLFLKKDGTVHGAGSNDGGELGDDIAKAWNNQRNGAVPLMALGQDVVAVVAAHDHSVFLKADGTVYTAGGGQSLLAGALGCGAACTDRLLNGNQQTPVQVEFEFQPEVVAITAGHYHTVFLMAGGAAFATGANTNGQLGDGSSTNRLSPVQITQLSDVVAITAGGDFSVFLTADGKTHACGGNRDGQLGDGTTQVNRYSPVHVAALGSDVAAIEAGGSHTFYQKVDGTIFAAGWNRDGQLGIGDEQSQTRGGYSDANPTPRPVTALGSDVVKMSAGGVHSIFIKADGTAYGTGHNQGDGFSGGQLGDGTRVHRRTPVPITALGSRVFAAAAGNAATVYLATRDLSSVFYGGKSGSCSGNAECSRECDFMFGTGGRCGNDCTGMCGCGCPGEGGWSTATNLNDCYDYCVVAYGR
jgi:alpha-tubulin suppressor-like RCC1 family protein